jgi:hypothetical protein
MLVDRHCEAKKRMFAVCYERFSNCTRCKNAYRLSYYKRVNILVVVVMMMMVFLNVCLNEARTPLISFAPDHDPRDPLIRAWSHGHIGAGIIIRNPLSLV